MDAFEQAFEYTMGFEGWSETTNDPDDPGGLTKFGVSKTNHPNVDVANLTLDGAKAIYRKEYWDAIKCSQFEDERVAIKLFDIAVNAGTRKAVLLLQQALCDMGSVVDVDGRIGPKTLAAANGADPDVLFIFLVALLETFYRSLGKPKYLKGWLRRARTLPHLEA